jgi:hypothetical protein
MTGRSANAPTVVTISAWLHFGGAYPEMLISVGIDFNVRDGDSRGGESRVKLQPRYTNRGLKVKE